MPSIQTLIENLPTNYSKWTICSMSVNNHLQKQIMVLLRVTLLSIVKTILNLSFACNHPYGLHQNKCTRLPPKALVQRKHPTWCQLHILHARLVSASLGKWQWLLRTPPESSFELSHVYLANSLQFIVYVKHNLHPEMMQFTFATYSSQEIRQFSVNAHKVIPTTLQILIL